MRNCILLLLILCLTFTGCAAEPADPVHTFDDLSIQIPTGYINLSSEEFAADLNFVFGLDPIAVNGLREEKATFQAYGLNLDLESYCNFVILANNVSATLEQKDGIYTFSYESGEFTYIATIWETEDAFWTVQAYCPTKNYAKAKKDMWNILRSVTV